MKNNVTEGTVSSGTLRPEDLIPIFAQKLEDLTEGNRRIEDVEILRLARRYGQTEEENEDATRDCIDSLFDALNRLAPEGMYFGANIGDAADFGFWTYYKPQFKSFQYIIVCETPECSNRGQMVNAIYDIHPGQVEEFAEHWEPGDDEHDKCPVCNKWGVLAEGLEEVN